METSIQSLSGMGKGVGKTSVLGVSLAQLASLISADEANNVLLLTGPIVMCRSKV